MDDQIKEDETNGECSTHGYKKTAYRDLEGKYEGKKALTRTMHGWKGNIKMDLKRNRIGARGQDYESCPRAPILKTDKWQALLNPIKNLQVP